MKANCNIVSGELYTNKREKESSKIVKKDSNLIEIVYTDIDTLETFECDLNELCGNSSFLYIFKKQISTYFLSIISVVVILFALISSSLYEDIMKKIIFESPFDWSLNDTVSMFFVLLFFLGLVLMPSILDGEGSEFKQILKSWVNKDVRILKRLKTSINSLDKKNKVNIYNIDLLDDNHWMWRLIVPILLNHFLEVNFYVRSDLKKKVEKRLKSFSCLNINLIAKKQNDIYFKNYELFFSQKEDILFTLLQLSSTNIFNNKEKLEYVSLELFEYCGRNFYDTKNEKNQLISGFQNFVNRCFCDFNLLGQHKSNQIFFQKNVKLKDLEDEKRRLSFYLRNHIEECLSYFDNPISLLVLYHYVKDIVLDEKRKIAILESLIESIGKKQQYDLINNYWFDISGEMFDSSDLNSFITSKSSIYRKLSINTLNLLISLFERNGKFEQALLIARYLFEINPNKYSIDISSLYERLGEYDNAYNALSFKVTNEAKPNDVEVRFYQRKSWIIVSQRKENKKDEGLSALNSLNKLLFSHQEFNEPSWLWHFYNIKANYDEWNEDYDLAIKNYMKCLSVPALGAFEYGATFINMSIAYRFKFIEDNRTYLSSIDKAIELGDIGIKLKESVGDRDEMPIVLHNQALNILYKLSIEDNINLAKKVIELASKAFDILIDNKSKKRLGMVLIELIIAKNIVKIESNIETELLKDHWQNMDEYEQKQAINIFNIYYEKRVVSYLNWLEI